MDKRIVGLPAARPAPLQVGTGSPHKLPSADPEEVCRAPTGTSVGAGVRGQLQRLFGKEVASFEFDGAVAHGQVEPKILSALRGGFGKPLTGASDPRIAQLRDVYRSDTSAGSQENQAWQTLNGGEFGTWRLLRHTVDSAVWMTRTDEIHMDSTGAMARFSLPKVSAQFLTIDLHGDGAVRIDSHTPMLSQSMTVFPDGRVESKKRVDGLCQTLCTRVATALFAGVGGVNHPATRAGLALGRQNAELLARRLDSPALSEASLTV